MKRKQIVSEIIELCNKSMLNRAEAARLLGLLNREDYDDVRTSKSIKGKHYYNLIYRELSHICDQTEDGTSFYPTQKIISFFNEKYNHDITLDDVKKEDFISSFLGFQVEVISKETDIINEEIFGKASNQNKHLEENFYELRNKYDELEEKYMKLMKEFKIKENEVNGLKVQLEGITELYVSTSNNLEI